MLFLQRTLGNLYKCYTVLKKLSAFGAITKPYVQFGRREPFEVTFKNHRATLLSPTLGTLHVMLTLTMKEVIYSVVSFSGKRLRAVVPRPGTWDKSQGSTSTSSGSAGLGHFALIEVIPPPGYTWVPDSLVG